MVATRKNGKPKSGHKNPILIPGIHRFGRSTMYHKKGIWAKRAIVNPKKVRGIWGVLFYKAWNSLNFYLFIFECRCEVYFDN